MVLREAVIDGRGRLILPKGETLDAHILERLARFGVRHVDIEGDSDGVEAPGEPEGILPGVTPLTILENIGRRYAAVGADPRMAVIRDVFTRVLSR